MSSGWWLRFAPGESQLRSGPAPQLSGWLTADDWANLAVANVAFKEFMRRRRADVDVARCRRGVDAAAARRRRGADDPPMRLDAAAERTTRRRGSTPTRIVRSRRARRRYAPRTLLSTAAVRFIGYDVEKSLTMAKRFWRIAVERGPNVEAHVQTADTLEGDEHAAERERLYRAALAVEGTAVDETYFILLDNSANAFDHARVKLARLVPNEEAETLLETVLARELKPDCHPSEVTTRGEAASALAQMIVDGAVSRDEPTEAALRVLEGVAEPSGNGHFLMAKLYSSKADDDAPSPGCENCKLVFKHMMEASHCGDKLIMTIAIYMVARMYESGRGVEQDLPTAHMSYFLAFKGGNPAAATRVSELLELRASLGENSDDPRAADTDRGFMMFQAMQAGSEVVIGRMRDDPTSTIDEATTAFVAETNQPAAQ